MPPEGGKELDRELDVKRGKDDDEGEWRKSKSRRKLGVWEREWAREAVDEEEDQKEE